MKVLSKEQFDAIQYTSVGVIRDFLPGVSLDVYPNHLFIEQGDISCLVPNDHWLIYDGHSLSSLPDEAFKSRYQPADALDLVFSHAVRLQSAIFAQEEKDFIAQADLPERTENSARIKQQILEKL